MCQTWSASCALGQPSNPYWVLSLWWSKHLDLQCGWRQRRQFFRHVLKDPLEHGRATWQHDMNVQIQADVKVTIHDVVERSVADSAGFNANETG